MVAMKATWAGGISSCGVSFSAHGAADRRSALAATERLEHRSCHAAFRAKCF
jgi:hypothetical protein